jgi:hypothetical protein
MVMVMVMVVVVVKFHRLIPPAQGFRDWPESHRKGSPFSLSDKVFHGLKHPLIKAGVDMMDAFFRQAE